MARGLAPTDLFEGTQWAQSAASDRASMALPATTSSPYSYENRSDTPGTIPVRNLPSGRDSTGHTSSGAGTSKKPNGFGARLRQASPFRKSGEQPPTQPSAKTGQSGSQANRSQETPKVLTLLEAGSLRGTLVKALREVWRYADEGLSISNQAGVTVGRDVPPIWRSIDAEETGIIVDAMLKAAQKNPYVAVAVRGITEAYTQLEIGIILVPRFIETWKFYQQFGFGAASHGRANRGPGTSGTIAGTP